MRDLVSDLRFAVRMLLRNPGFTAVAIVALALGVGANTAIFSVVNAVLLRPLPFGSAHRLVSIGSFSTRSLVTADYACSYPDFQDFRAQNHTLDHISAINNDTWALTGTNRQVTNLDVAIVSADLFPMLGVKPLMGRTFRRDEDENVAASPAVVVISQNAWRKHFGSEPGVVGKQITLNGRPFMIAGVMPAGFNFPVRDTPFDIWTTFAFSGDLGSFDGSDAMGKNRGSHYLEVVGTVKPGATPAQAKADLDVIVAALARKYPKSNLYRAIRVEPLIDRLAGKLRPVLLLLLGAVGCVLLVACANVANLLLARASTRHRELAIRAALGAGRLRVVRQVLTESVLLSLAGGAAGFMAGIWGNELLVRFGPTGVPRLGESRIDFVVFVFSLGVSLLTGVVFGLVPALRAAQSDPAEALKEGTRGSTEGLRSNKARSVLVVSEVALALVLLSCAGLLIRSLDRLNRSDPGFRSNNVLSAAITLPPARYPRERLSAFVSQIEDRLRRLPGVVSVGDVVILPLSGNDMNTHFDIEGRPQTRVNISGPGYFEAMGTPLRAGRDFQETDVMGMPYVAVVNDTFAKRYFPNENPIGKLIKPGIAAGEDKTPFREIVGIAGSVQQDRIGQKPLPEVFIPRGQLPVNSATFTIHTMNDARSLIPAVRSAVAAMDPDMPVDEVKTMDERVSTSLAQPRFQGFLLGCFAVVALTLTAVGLYGVISYSVAQRTHEIGTRMALGAGQTNILKLVVGQGMLLAAIGAMVGLAGALAVSRLLENMLYEIAPTDPLTLAGVAILVFAVAFAATVIPAVRAANVDPMVALRYE
jgi:putative ABC transport system permease protein